MKFSKAIPHSIHIHASDNNGFIVECGCARFTYTSPDLLLEHLNDFFKNTTHFESEYNKANSNMVSSPSVSTVSSSH